MKNKQIGCLSIHDAEARMRNCLERGAVMPGKHFREELANEGINLQDAWIVLRYGRIYDAPEKDIKTVDNAFLITVFSVKQRGRDKK